MIWNIPDDLWEDTVLPVLRELDPEPRTGRPRTDPRRALDGILYRLRSGVQWNQLPKCFGDDSSVHRTFQRWVERGVLRRIWGILVQHCHDLGLVEWQSADCSMVKARLGGITSAPTPQIGRKTV
jgi:putative transposase